MSQVLTQDRIVQVRRIEMDRIPTEELTGGRWYRKAAIEIAKDMLACRAIQVYENYEIESDKWHYYYVFREFRKDRVLP